MRASMLLVVLAACEPAWGVTVHAKYPDALPVEAATLAVACDAGVFENGRMAVKTDHDGTGYVGAIGGVWPVGCDVFVAKPGFRTHRIRYADLCPNGPEGCDRVFAFDLVLEPLPQ